MPEPHDVETYFTNKIKNSDLYKAFPVNLAKTPEELVMILLVTLLFASRAQDTVSEEEMEREITDLLESGQWDALAHKGLQWISQMPREPGPVSRSCYLRGQGCSTSQGNVNAGND